MREAESISAALNWEFLIPGENGVEIPDAEQEDRASDEKDGQPMTEKTERPMRNARAKVALRAPKATTRKENLGAEHDSGTNDVGTVETALPGATAAGNALPSKRPLKKAVTSVCKKKRK